MLGTALTRGHRPGVALAVTVGCLGLSAAPAYAQAPTPVSARTIDTYPASLQFDAAGNAVASWRGLAGTDPDRATPFVALAVRSPGVAWQTAPRLPATVAGHAVAVSPGGRIALATTRETAVPPLRSRSSVVLNLATTRSLRFSGPIRLDSGPARRLTSEGPAPTLALPKVAISPAGTVLVTWVRSYPRSRSGVWVRGVRSDGTPLRPLRLGPYGGEPFLAVTEDGTGVLAWRRGHRVLARQRSSSGRWGPVETAATVEDWAQIEQVALTAGSGQRALLTVVATARSSEGIRVVSSVHARIAGTGWRRGVLADFAYSATPQRSFPNAGTALPLITSEGRMRAVWTGLEADRLRINVTELFPETGGVGTGPALGVSDPAWDAALEDVAAGPDGRYAVAWFDLSDGRGAPSLAELDASGLLRSAPRLATERTLFGTQIAYEPGSGAPTVVWSQGGPGAYGLVSHSLPPITATP